MALHQVWQHKKARFTGTGAADHQHIFISGVFRILGPVGHHQPFCGSQNDVVPGIRVHERGYIFVVSPSCRPILHVFPKLLCVLALDTHGYTEQDSERNSDT